MVNAGDTVESEPSPSLRFALFHGLSAAAVAVFCYSTARLVPSLTETYWAPISALVVLYPDGDNTRKAAIERFLGTAIGCAIGGVAAALWSGHITVYGASVLLSVTLCHLLGLQAASRLCAVSVTVLTLIPRIEPAALAATHRFIEVSYGIACALLFVFAVDFIRQRRKAL